MNVKIANQTLLEIKEICDKFNAPLGVHHGTLLGIIRENRLLPWDHDLDFWFPTSTPQKKFKKVMKYLKKEAKFPPWERFRAPNGTLLHRSFRKAGFSIGFSQLFPSRNPKFLCRVGVALNYRKPTITLIPAKIYEPPKEIEFLGKMFLIPNRTEEWLRRQYGDWHKPIKNITKWLKFRTWKIAYVESCPESPWPRIDRTASKALEAYIARRN